MCMIKRSNLGLDYLKDINNIIEKVGEEELYISVSKILDVRFKDKIIDKDIPNTMYKIIYLPKLNELDFNIEDKNKKKEPNKLDNNEFINNYGDTTIVALAGLLLITMGLIISLVMMGR